MNLHINPHTEQPIYRQIERQLARAIAERQLHPGETLLPERELAAQLVVSPAAVHKAYLELESAGLCSGGMRGLFRVIDPGLGSIEGGGTRIAPTWLERELLTGELETARQLQRRLLPPAVIRRATFTVVSRWYPAGSLAGDFYDLIETDDHQIDLVIADTAGKGLAAGMIMAVTKSLLPLVIDEATPGEALTALNRRLRGILSPREFVAMAWARFDPHTGDLLVANAGLPDPAVLRAGERIEWIEAFGDRLPLGARHGSCYATRRLALTPKDRLLLLTDGIPEAVDAHGQTFGYQRLQRLLEEVLDWRARDDHDDAATWLDHLLDLASRRTSSLLTDDWTAMMLDFHPVAEEAPCSS